MAEAARYSAPHVVLVAAPGQGHVNPMLSIARYLARFEIGVTLAVTARSHAALMSQDALLGCKKLLNIRVEVLPENMPFDLTQEVSKLEAVNTLLGVVLRQGVHDLLQRLLHVDTPPCCLIVDGILPWAHDLARLFHLPHVLLWTSCASALSIGIHIPDFRARGFLPISALQASDRHTKMDFIPGLSSSLCMTELPHWFYTEEALQFIGAAFQRAKYADRVLVNSIYELESVVFDALRREDGVNAHGVGPLFLMSPSDCKSSLTGTLPHQVETGRSSSCLSWLDQQEKASVLYISFGTMASIEANVYEELAHGLEASGERFLWVVRQNEQINSMGAAEYDDDAAAAAATASSVVEGLLPKGFVQRTAERGLVISWAPQLEVLAHPSVAAFLTHCGWNSMLESLSNGVPMLGFPQEADQTANFKHMVHDWKVGLPLLPYNNPQESIIHRSHVREAVMGIMRSGSEEAALVRKCAAEWSTAIAHDLQAAAAGRPAGSSQSNLQNLVHDLKTGHFKPL